MRKLPLLTIFAISFALLEAIVVIYIRRILPEDGWKYIKNIQDIMEFLIRHKIFFIEQTREAGTIVILLCVAIFAGTKFKERFAYFLWIFAIWDIFYYIFLYIYLRWPDSLFTIDILFLIPKPWIAPVIVPVLCSIFMLFISILFLKK
ncbi:TPA: hypothetical protein DCX16_00275 [bacterium]|nr:hypothetical protein [bacterium]